MVNSRDQYSIMAVYQQKSSRAALTPGELDGMTNQGLYLSPTGGKAAPAADSFIPALSGKASARRLPMTDAFNTEAQQLRDAELDLRMGSKFEKVFGNGLFEGSDAQSPTAANRSGPSIVKMNGFFADPTKSGNSQSPQPARGSLSNSEGQDVTPDKGATPPGMGLVARRNANANPTTMSGRIPSSVGLQAPGPDDTEVLAFNDPDEATLVAVPRAVIPRTQSTSSHALWEAQVKQLIQSGKREEAVRIPAVPGAMVRCYVKRVKNFFSTHCCFQMFLDVTDVFLLAARKRKKSKTSSYVISLDLDDLKRDTDNCMAKVKANFVGTEYTLWGRQAGGAGGGESSGRDSPHGGSANGSANGKDNSGNHHKKGYNREDLVINFKQTALSTKGGPRSMYVVVPEPNAGLQSQEGVGSESLSHMLEMARKRELPPYLEKKVAIMSTKSPEYDERTKAYTLDFQGRVKEASVKNFQLVSWDHNTDKTGAELLLQFGKQGDDVYALDFTYPFNIELAFSVALASIDTKLCYTI